jgi:hypothetical protein
VWKPVKSTVRVLAQHLKEAVERFYFLAGLHKRAGPRP